MSSFVRCTIVGRQLDNEWHYGERVEQRRRGRRHGQRRRRPLWIFPAAARLVPQPPATLCSVLCVAHSSGLRCTSSRGGGPPALAPPFSSLVALLAPCRDACSRPGDVGLHGAGHRRRRDGRQRQRTHSPSSAPGGAGWWRAGRADLTIQTPAAAIRGSIHIKGACGGGACGSGCLGREVRRSDRQLAGGRAPAGWSRCWFACKHDCRLDMVESCKQ